MNRKLTVAVLNMVVSWSTSAACYGTDTFKTCTDNSGSTYYGNITSVQDYYPQAGSNRSQTSNTYEDATQTNDTATDRQSWNSTTTTSMTEQHGTDIAGMRSARRERGR